MSMARDKTQMWMWMARDNTPRSVQLPVDPWRSNVIMPILPQALQLEARLRWSVPRTICWLKAYLLRHKSASRQQNMSQRPSFSNGVRKADAIIGVHQDVASWRPHMVWGEGSKFWCQVFIIYLDALHCLEFYWRHGLHSSLAPRSHTTVCEWTFKHDVNGSWVSHKSENAPGGGTSWPILESLAGLPDCILTFNVSRGWIVPWEAALATAPAMTSLAGFISTWTGILEYCDTQDILILSWCVSHTELDSHHKWNLQLQSSQIKQTGSVASYLSLTANSP